MQYNAKFRFLNMVSIGFDLSINSTGVCVWDSDTGSTIYYVVGSKLTKKALAAHVDDLNLVTFNKITSDKGADYHVKEADKTITLYNIVHELRTIVQLYKPVVASIEGIAYSACGDVIGLAGLNYMVRQMLIEEKVPYTYIISPTTNKKYATGNGQAEKDIMISAWHKSDKKTIEFPTFIKVDDIADAYFLSRCGHSLLTKEKSYFINNK